MRQIKHISDWREFEIKVIKGLIINLVAGGLKNDERD